ncbi:MAG: TolB family protein, partial [Pirellulaceae bacterium]
PTFERLKAPETGRHVIQLTSGDGFTYPLYFYVPSITHDGKYLVYHRAAHGEVQLFRLNLATGESRQLTHATCPDTQWRPWCVPSGRGVLDHRSVLNVARDLVIYFDGNEVRAVHLETLEDRQLFVIPEDREPYGQNDTTPDGQWFVYIHTPRGSIWGEPCEGAAVVAYHFDTLEQRTLGTIDSAIFHVTAYDNEHFIVTPPADHAGMLITDFTSGKIAPLRDGDPGARGYLIHCQVTSRGIAYEVPEVRVSGLYDPFTHRRFEFPLHQALKYVHTGRDPEGRLWFYENSSAWDSFETHDMWAIQRLDPAKGDSWLRLTGTWPTFGGGQKAHFHPQLTPDRRWILFTGGDPRTRTNHIFLLDISDLEETQGISDHLLSPTGENDRS